MKESVLSFEEKTIQPWFTYFQIPGKYLKSFKTDPLKIRFQYMIIRISCLYLPQGHNFISIVWLWSTDEYVFLFYFERKSIFINTQKK